jgi:hypothetical protein
MRFRHAAALVLVVWYLTVPSIEMGHCLGCNPGPAGPEIVDVWGVYPNATDCDRVQKKLAARFVENRKHPAKEYQYQIYRGTSCNASDEPMFPKKGSQFKFLSPSEKTVILKTGIPG